MSEAASSAHIGRHLRGSYVRVLEAMLTEAEWNEKAYLPSVEEYLKVAEPSFALEPILLSTLLFMPNKLSDDILEGPDYLLHMHLVSHLGRLLNDVRSTRDVGCKESFENCGASVTCPALPLKPE